jgi:hypothetical protein
MASVATTATGEGGRIKEKRHILYDEFHVLKRFTV